MSDAIGKLLRLQGWRVLGVEDQQEQVRIRVQPRRAAAACPSCGRESRRVHARGKERRLWHGVVVGRRVELLARSSRLWCSGCAKAFTAPLPQIGKWQRRTEPGELYLRQELQTQSFGTVSRKTGVGYWALRRVLERSVEPISWERLLEQSGGHGLRLGVDEHSFRHQDMVITVTEVAQHRVLTLLPDDRCRTLETFLMGIPAQVREQIREVCIDMKEGFRKSIQRCLPQAKVVVDPFHVIQDANNRLDEARQLEQQLRRLTLKKNHFWSVRSACTPGSATIWTRSGLGCPSCASTT